MLKSNPRSSMCKPLRHITNNLYNSTNKSFNLNTNIHLSNSHNMLSNINMNHNNLFNKYHNNFNQDINHQFSKYHNQYIKLHKDHKLLSLCLSDNSNRGYLFSLYLLLIHNPHNNFNKNLLKLINLDNKQENKMIEISGKDFLNEIKKINMI